MSVLSFSNVVKYSSKLKCTQLGAEVIILSPSGPGMLGLKIFWEGEMDKKISKTWEEMVIKFLFAMALSPRTQP